MDTEGTIISGPETVKNARAYYHSYFFEYADGSIGWMNMTDGSSIDFYKLKQITAGAAVNNSGFSGSWKTWWGNEQDAYAELRFSEKDGIWTGSYDYDGGVLDGKVITQNGRLVIEGNWIQNSGSGWYRFTLSADGNSFTGEWGYTGDPQVRGFWNGEKTRP